LKNPNSLKDDGRLDVLVVAELSLDRIWGRFYVLNPLLIKSKAFAFSNLLIEKCFLN